MGKETRMCAHSPNAAGEGKSLRQTLYRRGHFSAQEVCTQATRRSTQKRGEVKENENTRKNRKMNTKGKQGMIQRKAEYDRLHKKKK